MAHLQDALLEKLPLRPGRPVAYLMAVLFALAAALIRWSVDGILPPGYPYVSFFPAVILCSFLFGRGPGSVTAVLCGLCAWYYFIPPFYAFALTSGTAMALGFYTCVVGVDIAIIHWMQRGNRRLMAQRERSEMLFRELQHRVANNIQMVGAVLTLQKRGLADPAALHALDEAAAKLGLIGRIQRQLYDTSGGRMPIDRFLGQLADDLVRAGGKPGVTHSVAAEPHLTLDPDATIPLSLIMAEAIANAIEHGFADRATGHVAIRLARDGAELRLTVTDDGAGLPDGFDGARPDSLGLTIANTLARQLQGRFAIGPAEGRGTCAELTLPAG